MILRSGLIVSAQARADNPLHGPVHMAAMARAAEQAGAVAIRANGGADIAAIRDAVGLPVLGIVKRLDSGDPVYITPDLAAVEEAASAGAQVIGLDATDRPRATPWREVLGAIHAAGCESFADISTFDEGMAAAEAGAAYVGTTLAGHTEATRGRSPDLALVERLARAGVRVVAEGGFDTPALAAEAMARGAHAVVVGTAITNPREITRGFVRALA
ncbi:N-acetylmannosamine-6-phosphate 2-epimerase [Wenxinia saemankumensis]|uniref:N-acylglucosamine-6-phosphate 2-epimerase n=1 Tax=Wenxinia saemankumensis TaxID=1447782 RepID=A0A1M6A2J8_9RHOB|nr:putative N-acetylmannosamine-6-phosphate 2-epimerase [Wenxinia saemankumensis]SHI30690.1 N-acylglucosamine-6-phosphate 2-epimerase [Wenxinia saemankumensis]